MIQALNVHPTVLSTENAEKNKKKIVTVNCEYMERTNHKTKQNNNDNNNNSYKIIDKMFKHEDDQAQCKRIFNTINNHPYTEKLGLTENIIIIISQLSVGELVHCVNKKCGELLCFLQQELSETCDEYEVPVQCPNPDCLKLLYGRACHVSTNSKSWHWSTTECEVADYCAGCLTPVCMYQHLKDCGKCDECDNVVMICKECFDPYTKIWICSNHIDP